MLPSPAHEAQFAVSQARGHLHGGPPLRTTPTCPCARRAAIARWRRSGLGDRRRRGRRFQASRWAATSAPRSSRRRRRARRLGGWAGSARSVAAPRASADAGCALPAISRRTAPGPGRRPRDLARRAVGEHGLMQGCGRHGGLKRVPRHADADGRDYSTPGERPAPGLEPGHRAQAGIGAIPGLPAASRLPLEAGGHVPCKVLCATKRIKQGSPRRAGGHQRWSLGPRAGRWWCPHKVAQPHTAVNLSGYSDRSAAP